MFCSSNGEVERVLCKTPFSGILVFVRRATRNCSFNGSTPGSFTYKQGLSAYNVPVA